ncbi:unnamed protein product [Clonostachys chloroleuca]|uniref:Uncharacterized protein n=1 Tax=Clonostachys chloroleuca TaxID=1926264 RepID=A0AA35Q8V1_9HYPO|nr:unnamed protein product [Clonostachys chloroleuca]
MEAEAFTDVAKYCFLVRSESVPPIFDDEPETSNYQVADRDFLRFVDGLEKPLGEDDAPNDIFMKQVTYAQEADRAKKLCLPRCTLSTSYWWTGGRRDGDSDNPNNTLYLYDRREPAVFGMEFSRNGRPFTGYLQEHRDNDPWDKDQPCVGAVTKKGKLLLRGSTPICVPDIKLFTVTLHGGLLHIVRHYNSYNILTNGISAGINMASNKYDFERGIRTVNKLRMAAAEFWESVPASVGDLSTCAVAPDDWEPLQEKLFSFPEPREIFASLRYRFERGSAPSLPTVEPRIGDEEFRAFKGSPWTAGSDSLRIFAKYAFDHEPPPSLATKIPLTQLGLDPADPKYEPYNGYVPSNLFISVEEDGYKNDRKLIASAMSSANFTKRAIRLVKKKKLPFFENLVASAVVVKKHEMHIWLFYLRGFGREADWTLYTIEHFPLGESREEFERGLRALAMVRKAAAQIQQRLCADVAGRCSGEIHVPAEPDRMEVSRSEDEGICKVNDTMAWIDLGAEVLSGDSAALEVETNAASQRGQKRGRDEDEAPRTMKHRRIIKTMPQARPGDDAGSVGPAAADTKANSASQDGQNRRRDEDDGETHRPVNTGIMIGTRSGSGSMFGGSMFGGGGGIFDGPVPVDMKTYPTSQDGQNRKQDEDKGGTPQTATTGTMRECQPSDGPAPLDMKANPASQDGRNRRREEDDDETPRPANFASKKDLKRRRDEEEEEEEEKEEEKEEGVPHPAENYRRPGVDASSRKKVKVEGDHDE